MSEHQRELQAALSQIEEHWDDERARRGLLQARRKLQVRGRRKLVVSAAFAAGCLVAIGFVALRRDGEAADAGSGAGEQSRPMRPDRRPPKLQFSLDLLPLRKRRGI